MILGCSASCHICWWVRHADIQVGLPATQVSSTHASKQATAIAVAVAVATVTVTVVAVVCATAMLLLS